MTEPVAPGGGSCKTGKIVVFLLLIQAERTEEVVLITHFTAF